jgi:hypothetical protein
MANEACLLQHRILMVDTNPTISATAPTKERIWPVFGQKNAEGSEKQSSVVTFLFSW